MTHAGGLIGRMIPFTAPGRLLPPARPCGWEQGRRRQPDRDAELAFPCQNPKRGNTVTYECRRVVTGNTPEGKSSVLYDSSLMLVEQASATAGPRQEDRAGAASRVMWTTQGFPVHNLDTSDPGLRQVQTAESDGTVFRIVEYAPGVTPRKHRTNSIDYAIVMAGSIDVELDNDTVRLDAGDALVQRGTIHNWVNNGTEACVIAFVLIAANPATANGIPLPAVG